ncbi:MAG: hypothetical protein WCF85_17750 [Rhodospirillaceae bacterium]
MTPDQFVTILRTRFGATVEWRLGMTGHRRVVLGGRAVTVPNHGSVQPIRLPILCKLVDDLGLRLEDLEG